MDSDIMQSLSGFDALWQRVTGREAPEQSAPAERTYALDDALAQLIDEQARAVSRAAALSRLTQGEGRAALGRQAAEGRLRRLRAEYYILTGLNAPAGPEQAPVTDRRGGLRDAFLQAERLAQLYGQAAGLADCPELARALNEFAAGEQARARQLRALLVECF